MACEKGSSAEGPFLVLSLLILALGIGFAGIKINEGLKQFRSYDRYVSVKGLATREVTADLAVWPIAHTVTGDDLAIAQSQLDAKSGEVIAFLKQYGLLDENIEKQQVIVTDLVAQSYRPEGAYSNRYILQQTINVRSSDIESISKAAENFGDLVKKGVVLAQTGTPGPTYLYTKLNDVKPAMIAEATKNARAAADQFASDSGQKVGSIRNAYQGMFQILPRDENYAIPENMQKLKTVRVVSTVDFYLE